MHNKMEVVGHNHSFWFLLSVIWITGIVISFTIAFHFSADVALSIHQNPFQPASLWGIFLSGILPLLMTFLFLKLRLTNALFILFFLKSFSFGFSIFAMTSSFEQGAWLLIAVCLLSQTCCCLLMFFLCCYSFFDYSFLKKKTLISVVAFLVISIFERLLLLCI